MYSEHDPYETLGVALTATIAEIKKAYITLAFQYYPDLNPMNPAANEKMEEVNKAYTILSNPTKRKDYAPHVYLIQ
jgi:curved DNA-binding protein CbpA